MLVEIVKSKYDTYNDLDELLYKSEGYLNPDLTRKNFDFDTLRDMLEYLFKTKGTYKNPTRASLIKAGLNDLKNEIKQTPKMEIIDNEPTVNCESCGKNS